jgi:dihydroorotate dehydrogenase
MAITVTGGATSGTIDEVLNQIRQLYDEHGMLEINVSYPREKKPKIRLVWNSNESKGDK